MTAQTLGVALIGVGMVSSTYADALSNLQDRVHLAGVLSRSKQSALNFTQKYAALTTDATHTPRHYESIDDLADDPNVQFVLLTTPPDARVALVETLAGAGKPILMEKPIERTLQAATNLIETCEAHDIPLGIMLQHRARPSAIALQDVIRAGNTGQLKVVEITVPWWREQGYYDQPGRGTYARDGGGVLISQAIHTLDLALQFTGPVESVTALTATTGFHQMEAEDFVAAGLRFSNGAVGSLFSSTASFPGRTEEISLHFEHVSAGLKSSVLTLDWQDGRSTRLGEDAATGAGADPMAFSSDWHRSMIDNFVSVVTDGDKPIASGRSALAVHTLIDALQRAGQSGQTETVTQPTTGEHGD